MECSLGTSGYFDDSLTVGDSLIDVKYISKTTLMLSNITKIVLEGRNELRGVDETSILKLMSQSQMLRSFCSSSTLVTNCALYSFGGSSVAMLDVSNTLISGAALAHNVYRNPSLKSLRTRNCRNLCPLESNAARGELSSLRYCTELDIGLEKKIAIWKKFHFAHYMCLGLG